MYSYLFLLCFVIKLLQYIFLFGAWLEGQPTLDWHGMALPLTSSPSHPLLLMAEVPSTVAKMCSMADPPSPAPHAFTFVPCNSLTDSERQMIPDQEVIT